MSEDETLLRVLGIHVAEVPDMPSTVAFVRDQRVLLVRADLDEQTRGWAMQWALERAAELLALHEAEEGR